MVRSPVEFISPIRVVKEAANSGGASRRAALINARTSSALKM